MATLRYAYQLLLDWLNQQLIQQKLNNPFGYVVLGLLALFVSGVVSFLGIKFGAILLLIAIAVPIAVLCLINLRFGLGVVLITSFMVNFLTKYSTAPVGIFA